MTALDTFLLVMTIMFFAPVSIVLILALSTNFRRGLRQRALSRFGALLDAGQERPTIRAADTANYQRAA
jgi:hypothetical protein